ncbi:MAG: hypothetical protein NTX36_05470 [Proteobacteria bacterium]|nr:hypothetical protein [Pseudomonadota bacterium]
MMPKKNNIFIGCLWYNISKLTGEDGAMITQPIKVKQYVVDDKGRKVAALINMKELDRLNKVLKLIPSSEAWLYENENALGNVQKGLQDAAQGKISKLNLADL